MATRTLRSTRAVRSTALVVGLLAAASVVGLVTAPTPGSLALVTDAGDRAPQRSSEPEAGTREPMPVADVGGGPLEPSVVGERPTTTTKAAPSAPGSTRVGTPGSAPKPAAAPVMPPSTLDTGLWVADGRNPMGRLSAEAGWTPLAWAPSSSEVAVARGGAVWAFNPGSGSRRQVLSRPGMVALRGAWSPDGRSLAVQLSDPASSGPRLYVVDVAGGAVAELPIRNLMTSIAYTPNGCLAFADSVDGTTGIAVHCPGQPRHLIPMPINALVAGLGSSGLAYTGGPSGISVVDNAGRVAPGVAGQANLYGSDLAWDQAHGTIVWRGSHNGPTDRVRLYASRPGGSTTTLTSCSASPPTASGDGTLVYADCDRKGPAVLQRRAGPSGEPQTVGVIPYSRAATPLISPDGRWILAAMSPF